MQEKGNAEFQEGMYALASNLYVKALQFVCVDLPSCREEALLMNDLAISLNLNSAACCLKVINYAGVKAFCILSLIHI